MKNAKYYGLDEDVDAINVNLKGEKLEQYFLLKRQKLILEARDNFYLYCRLVAPNFYKEDRIFLKKLCDTIQAFYDNRLINSKGEVAETLLLNIPPRHGKTFTAGWFVTWALGRNHNEKFISCSYNETLSTRFSKKIRDDIDTINIDKKKIFVSDIFPDLALKQGDSSATIWSVADSYFTYLATSPGSSMTGMGCSFGIIDDLIKNWKEANNTSIKDDHWDWYANTFQSRLEQGAKQLIIMTRWAEDDLCGRILLKEIPGVYLVKFPAYNEKTKTMLCPTILSEKNFTKKSIGEFELVQANYQQNPRIVSNSLYPDFQTYTSIPEVDRKIRKNYTDCADKGEDFFCSIVYDEIDGMAYVIDVIYTDKDMDVTEQTYFDSMVNNDVRVSYIESNNGGEGFARNIKKMQKAHNDLIQIKLKKLEDSNFPIEKKEKIKQELEKIFFKTALETFHQGSNKESRIISYATQVCKNIIFPANWKQKYPKFAKDVLNYSRIGKNKHDDAPDTLTGIIEKMYNVVIKLRGTDDE